MFVLRSHDPKILHSNGASSHSILLTEQLAFINWVRIQKTRLQARRYPVFQRIANGANDLNAIRTERISERLECRQYRISGHGT